MFSGDGHDTGRALRRSKAVPGQHDRWCRRSAVVPMLARPAAKPAVAPPSPPLRNPDPGRLDGLRALRFPGGFRFGGSLGAPFFKLLRGGRHICQLSIGPFFAGLPVGVHLRPEFTSGIDLLLRNRSLFASQETRACLALHRVREAVVRTVTSLGVSCAGATGLAAFDPTFGQGAAAHGLGIGQISGELVDAGRNSGWGRNGHGSILRHMLP